MNAERQKVFKQKQRRAKSLTKEWTEEEAFSFLDKLKEELIKIIDKHEGDFRTLRAEKDKVR